MKHFSTLAGGVALGVMMIPIAVRSTEEFLRAVPQSLREARWRWARASGRAIVTVVIPAAIERHPDGDDAGRGARRGRDRAAAVHRLQQPLLESRAGTSRRPRCR